VPKVETFIKVIADCLICARDISQRPLTAVKKRSEGPSRTIRDSFTPDLRKYFDRCYNSLQVNVLFGPLGDNSLDKRRELFIFWSGRVHRFPPHYNVLFPPGQTVYFYASGMLHVTRLGIRQGVFSGAFGFVQLAQAGDGIKDETSWRTDDQA
jgi:hypothetical protein